MTLLILFVLIAFAYAFYKAAKGIEAEEAEYDKDPEAYERLYPEHREFF